MDLIIKNAKVLTLSEKNEEASSVAVKDGRIIGVWQTETPPEHLIKAHTKVVDLEGATLIPGFIDTHNHILSYGLMLDMVNCSSPLNKNITDILEKIRQKAEVLPKGEWIQGYGYDDTVLVENRHPTRKELDAVAPDHPVYINHLSGHIAAVNSQALKLAGIEENVEDSSKGHFGRDEDGILNGVLFEFGAKEVVNHVMPQKTVDEMIQLLSNAVETYLAVGITTNTVAAVGMMYSPEVELAVHYKAGKTGVNPMHTRIMLVHQLLEEGGLFSSYTAEALDDEMREKSDGRVRFDGAKLFQDGSIQGLTAALRDPYISHENLTGELFHSQEVLNEKFVMLHKRGFRIAVHGNGDRAIGSILEGYAHVLQEEPRADHRHRVEHAQTASGADLTMMQKLGVQSSFFINHIYYFGDRHKQLFLGEERAKRMNPLKTATEKGIQFTLHSDCPITPISPLFSIWAAVNRVTSSGEVLGEEERCDVLTALKSMTIYGAKLNFEEEEAGSIEVGKRADFAVLNENPLTIDPMNIKDIQVLSTYIDGKVVYSKEMEKASTEG